MWNHSNHGGNSQICSNRGGSLFKLACLLLPSHRVCIREKPNSQKDHRMVQQAVAISWPSLLCLSPVRKPRLISALAAKMNPNSSVQEGCPSLGVFTVILYRLHLNAFGEPLIAADVHKNGVPVQEKYTPLWAGKSRNLWVFPRNFKHSNTSQNLWICIHSFIWIIMLFIGERLLD